MSDEDPNRSITKAEFDRLEEKVTGLVTDTRALVDAWNAAGGLVKFVKLIATLMTALGGIWLILTHGFNRTH